MNKQSRKNYSVKDLLSDIEELKRRLSEAHETLDAIRSGAVDGIVVSGPDGDKVFTLQGADHPYRVLIEAMHEGAVVISADGIILYSNQAFANLLATPLENVFGKSVREFVDPKDLVQLDSLLNHAEEGAAGEMTLRTMSGIPVITLLSITKFSGSGTEAFCLLATDLTEQKRRDQIVTSAEFSSVIFDHLPEAIIVCDQAGQILRANQVAVGICGINPIAQLFAEAFPLRFEDRSFPGSSDSQHRILPSLFKHRRGRPIEASLQTSDGRFLDFLVSVQPLTGVKGNQGWVITMSDITEQKRTESELLKISKLESLGMLAGGIAHDFNNHLAAIVGNLSLAKIMVDPDSKVFNRLEKSQKVAMQAQVITQQLLAFSKGGMPSKETIPIAALVKDAASFAMQGSNIRCDFSIPDDLWLIEVDEGQIRQVIQNLILNARQAMPDGGKIQIQAKNMVLDSKDTSFLPTGEYVKILIKDQGPGIPKEHLDKIFDPFFTTKPTGSGLGLTSSYWIIKRHEGHILVESEPGAGAAFSIYLPKSEKEATAKAVAQEHLTPGQGRILFMDDDESMRELATEILQQLGYEIDCVEDGLEAIELFRKAHESGRSFTAVILDLTVRAGMGGQETVKQLRKIDPEVRAIVSSGYSNDPVLSDFKNYGFSGRVAKPYTAEKLSQILADVIKKTIQNE